MRTSVELDRQAVLEEIAPRGWRTPVNASVGDPRGKAAAGNVATIEGPGVARDDVRAWHAVGANGFGDVATAGPHIAATKPTAYEVHRAARAFRSRLLGDIVIAAIREVGAFLRRALARQRQRRQASALHDALRELDDHTLRDLGLRRSEITAVVSAEPAGRARARESPASYELFL
jgi:uncharacterized protein YjiS (DUF1127 family)